MNGKAKLLVIVATLFFCACQHQKKSLNQWVKEIYSKPDHSIKGRILYLEPNFIHFIHLDEAKDRKLSTPVLFVHGIAGQWSDYEKLIHLARKEFKIFAIDLPGFGESHILDHRLTIKGSARMLRNFVNRLGYKTMNFVCHSMGAQICLKLSLIHPDLVNKLILIDAAGTYDRAAFIKNISNNFVMIRSGDLADEKLRSLSDLQWYDVDLMKRLISSNPNTLMAIASFKENLRSDLRYLATPTLIIWGEDDPIFSIDNAFYMKENINGAQLKIVAGAKHSPHQSHPEQVYRWIKDFLQQ